MSLDGRALGKYYFFVDGQKKHPNDYCSRTEVIAALKIALEQESKNKTDACARYNHTKRILEEFEAIEQEENNNKE